MKFELSESHFHKNTNNLWILQHTDFGDCWTLSRSLVYQLQWMENLILTRYGFCKWNESKVSYWEFIGWDITMNGNLKFVKFDGHYRITHRQDSFTWFFCATFFFAIIRSRHKYWTQEKKFKTFYISLACEYRFRYFVEYLKYQNMSVWIVIFSDFCKYTV